jgi:hypothetical protein
MFGACSGLAAWLDLTAIGNEALRETVGVFIIDFANMIVAELANLTT